MTEYFKSIDKKIVMLPTALSIKEENLTEELRQVLVTNFKEQIALMDFRDSVNITSDYWLLKRPTHILRCDFSAHLYAVRVAIDVMRRRSMEYRIKEKEESWGSTSYRIICRTHRKLE